MPREGIPIIEPYNPLDKRNLGTSVAVAMPTLPVHTPPLEPLISTGVYTIYYRGDSIPYKRLVDLNKEGYNVPIYAGKTIPADAREGGLGINVDHGLALFSRLSEHLGPVSKVNNLNKKDFMCRYFVMDDI